MIDVLFDIGLYSKFSLIGLIWTIFTFYLMFSKNGQVWLANPISLVFSGIALSLAITTVTGEISQLMLLSQGVKPIDVIFNYGAAEITQFANALDAAGRRSYAMFQLGQDALAPPAFCCLLMSVYRSTVQSETIKKICNFFAFSYLVSVLLANNLMPVIMLNFPDKGGITLGLLYYWVPMLDIIKYSSEAIAYVLAIGAWLWQIVYSLRGGKKRPVELRQPIIRSKQNSFW